MGYCIYWEPILAGDAAFQRFAAELDKVVNMRRLRISRMANSLWFLDNEGRGDSILFSGISNHSMRGSCKTGRLPYTVDVKKALILAVEHGLARNLECGDNMGWLGPLQEVENAVGLVSFKEQQEYFKGLLKGREDKPNVDADLVEAAQPASAAAEALEPECESIPELKLKVEHLKKLLLDTSKLSDSYRELSEDVGKELQNLIDREKEAEKEMEALRAENTKLQEQIAEMSYHIAVYEEDRAAARTREENLAAVKERLEALHQRLDERSTCFSITCGRRGVVSKRPSV